jgi:dTDP-4-amino-4,6-dideoxygalactose transaminase
MDAFKVVRDFEAALCEYTGAPYVVTTTSCTAAILLALAYKMPALREEQQVRKPDVFCPKRTYVGVPMSIVHAGGHPVFVDQDWTGAYQFGETGIWDSARYFSSDMHHPGAMECVSFHWSKILGIQQGGAILHDDPEADEWLRRARFDGRAERVAPKDDVRLILGWHAYMSPEIAAEGLVRLSHLPRHNKPLPWGPGTGSDYPDLSLLECFK